MVTDPGISNPILAYYLATKITETLMQTNQMSLALKIVSTHRQSPMSIIYSKVQPHQIVQGTDWDPCFWQWVL